MTEDADAVERWLMDRRDAQLDPQGCPETEGRTGAWWLLDELVEECREKFGRGPREDQYPEVRELTREEGIALFDRASRRILGIPGEEFLSRWDRGEYDADDSKAAQLSMLIPFAR